MRIAVEEPHALTLGKDGAIYVSGETNGNLDGQTNSGQQDAFITKYNPDGTKVWTKLLGTDSYDVANALTTGNDGAIYVAGTTNGNLDGQTAQVITAPGFRQVIDAFITKYNPDGTKVWTKLLGTGTRSAKALTTGNDGAIYVVGSAFYYIAGSAYYDQFITKYDPDGTKVWAKLLGTATGSASALTTGNDGAIYVAGTTNGNLDGQTNSGDYDAFITKYNPDGTKVWTKLLGTSSEDIAQAITTGKDGAIYISGKTYGNLDGQVNSGSSDGDGFITKYNPDGTKVWTRLLGASYSGASSVTTSNDGAIYVGTSGGPFVTNRSYALSKIRGCAE